MWTSEKVILLEIMVPLNNEIIKMTDPQYGFRLREGASASTKISILKSRSNEATIIWDLKIQTYIYLMHWSTIKAKTNKLHQKSFKTLARSFIDCRSFWKRQGRVAIVRRTCIQTHKKQSNYYIKIFFKVFDLKAWRLVIVIAIFMKQNPLKSSDPSFERSNSQKISSDYDWN